MLQNIPVYRYECGDASLIFSPQSDFWVTSVSGGDGMDVSLREAAACGQIGTLRDGAALASRDVTISGVILGDLDANEQRLKDAVRPLCTARLFRTCGGRTWYLEGEPKTTPIVTDCAGRLPFQFKFHCYFPLWRTQETLSVLLGGLSSAWFPAPVSTAGSFAVSLARKELFTSVRTIGNAESGFTVTLRAAARVVNPGLTLVSTGHFIRLNVTFAAGESAVVSTLPGTRGCTFTAADGTASNGFSLLDVDSDLHLALAPGENIFRLAAESGRDSLDCRLFAPLGVSASV